MNAKTVSLVDEAPPLREVTEVNTLVKGTSGSSRYVTVFVSPIMNMAARVTHELVVSIRVETVKTTMLGMFDQSLKELGLSTNPNKGYASVHLTASTPVQAVMTVDAYMAGLAMILSAMEASPNSLIKSGSYKTLAMAEVCLLKGKGA
jgi:hypothetical protein